MTSYNTNLTECPHGCPFDERHVHRKFTPNVPKIANNILEVIGNTPLVRLNKIPQQFGLKCEILVKCEFLNPGGSIKDRAGYNMIKTAEEIGTLKKNDQIVEATSGNTGIGIALANAVQGRKTIITMNDKMAVEKEIAMKVLGAKIIRTPYQLPLSDPGHYVTMAKIMSTENDDIKFLNQYDNVANPCVHYDITSEELLYQTDEKIDILVIGAGTGGTITGISNKIKSKLPDTVVIGVDPYGSILAKPDSLNQTTKGHPWLVEGVGQLFSPKALSKAMVDEWIKTDDKDSLDMSLRLCKDEGLLVGGSSGTALCGAINYCKKNNIGEGKRVVVIMPDGIRNYLKKFCDDDWMISQKLLSLSLYSSPNSKFKDFTLQQLNLRPQLVYNKNLIIEEAVNIFKTTDKSTLIITNDDNKMIGVVRSQELLKKLAKENILLTDSITKVFSDQFTLFPYNEITVDQLSTLCEKYTEVFLEKILISNVFEYYIATSKDFFSVF